MTEPLKPRIDFAGPLEAEAELAFKAQQTFSDVQAQHFAPVELESDSDNGPAEAAVDAALRPKRSV